MVSGRLQDASRLMGLLQDFGDNGLLLAGMHEFMEGSGFSDISMQRTSTMQRHLEDADMFAGASMRTGDYGLQKYVPASILALATMLAVPHRCAACLVGLTSAPVSLLACVITMICQKICGQPDRHFSPSRANRQSFWTRLICAQMPICQQPKDVCLLISGQLAGCQVPRCNRMKARTHSIPFITVVK